MDNLIRMIRHILSDKRADKDPDRIMQTALERTGYIPSIQEIELAYTVIKTQLNNNNQFAAYQ